MAVGPPRPQEGDPCRPLSPVCTRSLNTFLPPPLFPLSVRGHSRHTHTHTHTLPVPPTIFPAVAAASPPTLLPSFVLRAQGGWAGRGGDPPVEAPVLLPHLHEHLRADQSPSRHAPRAGRARPGRPGRWGAGCQKHGPAAGVLSRVTLRRRTSLASARDAGGGWPLPCCRPRASRAPRAQRPTRAPARRRPPRASATAPAPPREPASEPRATRPAARSIRGVPPPGPPAPPPLRTNRTRRVPHPRTNRTRRVPHPVLIGHAASRTPRGVRASGTKGTADTPCEANAGGPGGGAAPGACCFAMSSCAPSARRQPCPSAAAQRALRWLRWLRWLRLLRGRGAFLQLRGDGRRRLVVREGLPRAPPPSAPARAPAPGAPRAP
jgi:hypothetical protein